MPTKDIFNQIHSTKNYRHICDQTLYRLIATESKKYKQEKEILKAVKNKLHQIYGTFIQAEDVKQIQQLFTENQAPVDKEVCLKILKLHSSTAERLTFLDDFYQQIFALTGVPTSILDIACGLNPFAIPWMQLGNPTKYAAGDIDKETIQLINRYLGFIGFEPLAKVWDFIYEQPTDHYEVVFLLKFLPVVEQQAKGFSQTLLTKLNTDYLVVSFPLKSISGKNVGMLEHYEKTFRPVFENLGVMTRMVFPNELVYIIKK